MKFKKNESLIFLFFGRILWEKGINEYFEGYVKQDKVDLITEEIGETGVRKMNEEYQSQCEKHFKKILDDKKFIIEKIWCDNPNTEIYYPVNLDRLLIYIRSSLVVIKLTSDCFH